MVGHIVRIIETISSVFGVFLAILNGVGLRQRPSQLLSSSTYHAHDKHKWKCNRDLKTVVGRYLGGTPPL